MNETEKPNETAAPAESASSTPPATTPAAAVSEGDEVVRKVYVRDLRDKDRVRTVFKVTKKTRVTARSGKVFVAITLADKTGEIDARVFDRIDELDAKFSADDYVLAEGNIIAFHGKPQIVLDNVERLEPEPLDPAEFILPATPAQPEPAQPHAQHAHAPASQSERPVSEEARTTGGGVAQIREIVDQRVQDPNVRALLFAFLDDPEISDGLRVAPAAKGIHHAYKGGLADHILSVMRLTLRVADHYPMADRDLLLAGALLHDIGKVKELSYTGGFDYTDEGRLVGHLVMTAQKIREKSARIPNFPPLLEQHITHIVLAHHGQLEYGSPKLPMTIEAFIVHAIDSLDSRMASWLEAMQRDPNEKWTDVVRHYDRNLWKGPLPTSRGRAPVEPRRRKDKPPRQKPQPPEKPHAPAAEGEKPAAERHERPERGERHERPDRGERPASPGGGPKRERREREPKAEPATRLTFKPLAALAGEASKKEEPASPPEAEAAAAKPDGESQS